MQSSRTSVWINASLCDNGRQLPLCLYVDATNRSYEITAASDAAVIQHKAVVECGNRNAVFRLTDVREPKW